MVQLLSSGVIICLELRWWYNLLGLGVTIVNLSLLSTKVHSFTHSTRLGVQVSVPTASNFYVL